MDSDRDVLFTDSALSRSSDWVCCCFVDSAAPCRAKKRSKVKEMPYESGMDPIGDVRKPLDIKFYLLAVLFLVFDVELLFLYPWAVSLNNPDGIPAEYRMPVLWVLLVLLVTLGLAYLVALKKGIFEWRK